MKYLLIGLLKVWRLVVSPLYGNVCRYYPSCSAYALRAVQYHGAVKGSWYAGRRLLRCHPWAPGGYDPVPGTPEFDEEMRDLAKTAATMDQDTLDVARIDTQARGGGGPETASAATPDLLPHGQMKQGQMTQGRAATVAQVRGKK